MRLPALSAIFLAVVVMAMGSRTAVAEPEAEPDEALNDEGVVEFRAGRHARAAELFRLAHARVPRAKFVFNLALALEASGDCPGALAGYRHYRRRGDVGDTLPEKQKAAAASRSAARPGCLERPW